MATKENAPIAAKTAEAAVTPMAKTAEAAIDPMAETESVLLPKISGDEQTVFVGLNGQSWLIPRGKRVDVPKPVAEVLRLSEKANEAADEYSQAQQKLGETVQGAPN